MATGHRYAAPSPQKRPDTEDDLPGGGRIRWVTQTPPSRPSGPPDTFDNEAAEAPEGKHGGGKHRRTVPVTLGESKGGLEGPEWAGHPGLHSPFSYTQRPRFGKDFVR
jgi:hypothetical protein